MVKIRELRGMSEKDLTTRLGELRLELSKERAASEIGTSKNPGRVGAIRREIARILTIQNEKKLGIVRAKRTTVAPKTAPKPAPTPKETGKDEEKKVTATPTPKVEKSSPSPLPEKKEVRA